VPLAAATGALALGNLDKTLQDSPFEIGEMTFLKHQIGQTSTNHWLTQKLLERNFKLLNSEQNGFKTCSSNAPPLPSSLKKYMQTS